jgi:hypothetical protein
MLRLADRKIDRRLARLNVGKQFGQSHEGRPGVGVHGNGRMGGSGNHALKPIGTAGPPRRSYPDTTSGVKTRLTIGFKATARRVKVDDAAGRKRWAAG